MTMLMNQIAAAQERLIVQNTRRRTVSDQFAGLQQETVVGNILDQTKIVRRGDHGFLAFAPTDQ